VLVLDAQQRNASHRQIFTDGRPLPEDPQPSWNGYSTGKWEGDTLMVETTGFRWHRVRGVWPKRRWIKRVVLLAEDDPILRNFLLLVLHSQAYAVLVAVDGQEALELATAFQGLKLTHYLRLWISCDLTYWRSSSSTGGLLRTQFLATADWPAQARHPPESCTGGYAYQLTKGIQVALLLLFFHKRLCGPLANSCFHHKVNPNHQPASKLEAAYHKADSAIQQTVDLLAAAWCYTGNAEVFLFTIFDLRILKGSF
jgi:CheY-like chemotaxis protein